MTEDEADKYYTEGKEDCPYWEEIFYTSSTENNDYGPSNPWDAPGMSITDFI